MFGQIGPEITELFKALSSRGADSPKGEFETTRQYDARMASILKEFPAEYKITKDQENGDFSYDADKALMKFAASPTYAADIRESQYLKGAQTFTSKSILRSQRNYAGVNAFGASTLVEESIYDDFDIAFSVDSAIKPQSIGGSFAMEQDFAARGKRNLRIQFVGWLADAEIHKDLQHFKPKIDDPVDMYVYRSFLFFKIDRVEIVDMATGAIIKTVP